MPWTENPQQQMLVEPEVLCYGRNLAKAVTPDTASFITSRINRLLMKIHFQAWQNPLRLTPSASHPETHQLKGQHFIGNWVIYNLLKVSSNCNRKTERERERERITQSKWKRMESNVNMITNDFILGSLKGKYHIFETENLETLKK